MSKTGKSVSDINNKSQVEDPNDSKVVSQVKSQATSNKGKSLAAEEDQEEDEDVYQQSQQQSQQDSRQPSKSNLGLKSQNGTQEHLQTKLMNKAGDNQQSGFMLTNPDIENQRTDGFIGQNQQPTRQELEMNRFDSQKSFDGTAKDHR